MKNEADIVASPVLLLEFLIHICFEQQDCTT